MGRMRNRDTVFVLDRHPGESLFDHSFQSKTYERKIVDRFNEICRKFGAKHI
jgi:hypothetical protein